ncbi:IS6 family transposase [Ochrobactrum teleogrylli]
MNSATPTYKNHRFPIEIVARAIWLYFRFNVSLREVEEMMLERGVVVSYETIRRWCRSHGSMITARLLRKSPSSSDVWHLDEVVVRIGGRKCWLWRAVDQDGYVLDEIVQVSRNAKAAKRLLVRLLKKQGLAPKRIITDKLRSYGTARRQVMPAVEHRSHKGLNNRAENSHLPFRKRERTRQGFRSIRSLQQFVSIFSAVRNHFVPAKSNRPAAQIRSFRQAATTQWRMAALQLA